MPPSPERIPVRKVAAILGIEPRTVQRLAKEGEIPSAAKIGGRLTFDEQRVRAWVKEREDEWQHSTSEAASGGDDSNWMGESDVEALEQVIGPKRKSA